MPGDNENEDITFIDEENYFSSKGGISFREIVMKHFNKCVVESSKEMTEGGLMRRFVDNKVVEFPVPNQREIYINCVESLRQLIEPKVDIRWETCGERFRIFDNKLYKLNDYYNERKQKLRKEFSELNFRVKDRHLPKFNQQMKELNTEYEVKKVQLYGELFLAISFLLSELNYFEEL